MFTLQGYSKSRKTFNFDALPLVNYVEAKTNQLINFLNQAKLQFTKLKPSYHVYSSRTPLKIQNLMTLRITYQEHTIACYYSLGHEISSNGFPVYSLRNHNSCYCRQHILLIFKIKFKHTFVQLNSLECRIKFLL